MTSPVYIFSSDETYVKKFRIYGTKIVFKFNPVPEGVTELDWLRQGFSMLVEQMKEGCLDTDQLGFTLTSKRLDKERGSGYVKFTPAKELEDDILWTIFGGIIQSNNESSNSSDEFIVECTRVSLPVGSGRKRPGLFNNYTDESRSKHSIVQIKNIDNLCLPRALVVAIAHCTKDPLYKAIRQDRKERQKIKADQLMREAGVEIPPEGAGIPQLERFQAYLTDYKIIVYNYNTRGRDLYFEGENENAELKLNLLFNRGHYNVITSLTGVFGCNYYCESCHVPYKNRFEHKCNNVCYACKTVSPPCEMQDRGVYCDACNRTFKNPTCHAAHLGSDVCKVFKKCKDCLKLINSRVYRSGSVHVCGEFFCNTCFVFVTPGHQCYIKPDCKTPPKKDFLFIFFDLETRQDTKLDTVTSLHCVNLCVSKHFCWECIEDPSRVCERCENRTRVFKNDPIKRFMEFVMTIRKEFKQVCVLAHNGQGFDFQFVLKYVLEETKFTPELIMRGTKITMMSMDNVKFIDSLNYFPMPLSALPKAFDLGPEMKKGYFPHLFNTVDNQEYVGPIPEKTYYCPGSMFKKAHEEFEKWHEQQVSNNVVFDFKKELVEYCISDVDILSRACIKFRSMFIKECIVDPFLEAVTIASACNLVFRRNHLKPNTIGLVPKDGYRMTDMQSKIALQWLSWEEEKRELRIQHAGRGKESKVDGMKVDGLDEAGRVYEFQGCYFHGCPKCFPLKRDQPLKDDPSDTLQSRYQRTQEKINKLKTTGREVIEIWECVFREEKRRQKLNHLDSLAILNHLPLNARDAFFGGRTGNAKSYHKCIEEEGETINYVDVCSLYPYVNKYCKYPVGHPEVFVGDRECRARGMNAEGLMKCKVLPPLDLYHPVLPMKMHNKLMFALCRTCVETQNKEDCHHSSDERALVGTWVMDELREAIKQGYTILDMYELWQYDVAEFERGGLFTDFVNQFLRIKQEASGYPSWCLTEEDRDAYISAYFQHEGIRLNHSKIAENAGLRSLAKLILNSFWGKFGQRENMSRTIIIRTPDIFFKLLTSPEIQVNSVKVINEELVVVNWEYISEIGHALSTVNVVVAAYTTAHARLTLYKHLDRLKNQVLYYDTDSVIYSHKPGQNKIETGDYLGEMTDELSKDYGPGSYITEFVSGGPKTYAYLVFSTKETEPEKKIKEVCKVKGLTLNITTGKMVNFEQLKKMILNGTETPTTVSTSRIRRTDNKDLITVMEDKVFRITGAKRRAASDPYDTLPFGFKRRV